MQTIRRGLKMTKMIFETRLKFPGGGIWLAPGILTYKCEWKDVQVEGADETLTEASHLIYLRCSDTLGAIVHHV